MHNPDFHRIVTPAILYVLDRSAKNGVSITEVVRALDPDMAKLSFETVWQMIKKYLVVSRNRIENSSDTSTKIHSKKQSSFSAILFRLEAGSNIGLLKGHQRDDGRQRF
mmetsp:Transcript_29104/g.39553  ORF Transcript_29104/g.39553 Transcript_29104/m.39553 type:complete len:109 (-) Transcript_29104:361-687(-)